MDFVKKAWAIFVETVTKKYFCFEGTAARCEFWSFALVSWVISFVLQMIPTAGCWLSVIFSLGMLLPTLGIGARRLHDIGKSGWLQLIALIPVIGAIVLIVFWAQPGKTVENA